MSSLQDPIVSHPVPSPGEERGITLRSFLIGLGVVCLVNLWVTWSDFIIHSSAWNLSHFPMVNFIPFVILTVLSSVSDRLFGPRWSFSSAELATVLAMGLVGSVVPTNGFMGYVLGILAMPYYLATPENGWALYFHPHLADWMAPRDENDAVRYFFEGLPKGVHIPWETWASPLFWWLTFAASITLISACTVVILRKQWTENERLDYPIISVGIDMALRSNPRNWLPEYMKGKLFWGGFSVACGIVCWNIPSYFIPGLPEFPLLPRWFTLAAGFPTIDFHISFFALAFAFFARLEALFSVWFFFLIFLIQSAVFNRFGFTIGTSGDPWSSHNPAVGWQSWGSLCFIVAWGIWVARHHLRDVFSKAIWGVTGEGRAEEMMSYRMALTGLVGGLVYAIGFLYCAGMNYTMAIALLLSTLIGYLGVSRILVETGLLYVVVPVTGQSSTVYFLGSRGLPESSMTAMAFTYILVTRGCRYVHAFADPSGQAGRSDSPDTKASDLRAWCLNCGRSSGCRHCNPVSGLHAWGIQLQRVGVGWGRQSAAFHRYAGQDAVAIHHRLVSRLLFFIRGAGVGHAGGFALSLSLVAPFTHWISPGHFLAHAQSRVHHLSGLVHQGHHHETGGYRALPPVPALCSRAPGRLGSRSRHLFSD